MPQLAARLESPDARDSLLLTPAVPRWLRLLESRLPALLEGVIPMKLGVPEMLVILMIVILIFGANRLPELGRGIGKGIRNFKDATREGAEKHE
jgi:sec-independent protein translocase protein TatA